MAIWHTRSRRKRTSGKFRRSSKRKKSQMGREFTETSIGDHNVVRERVRGGNTKMRLKKDEYVNLNDSDSGETSKEKIQDVLENDANPNLVRRDILTKGTIVNTEKGRAKITSRLGQEGILNAVVLEE